MSGPWNLEPIVADYPDTMLTLTCIHHQDLRWLTKNLGWIGARGLTFHGLLHPERDGKPFSYISDLDGETKHAHLETIRADGTIVRECDCSAKDLRVVMPDGSLREVE